MARRVFFSFHYEADVWRAGQVRNSWVTKDREEAGFWDAAAWEEVKKKGDEAIKRWIDKQLDGTSVTAVLIGSQTATREYVQYEIIRSHERGNGLLGIYIDQCKDKNGLVCNRGSNPFAFIQTTVNGHKVLLSDIYPTYDWVSGDGYKNLASWVEAAAKKAGK